MTTENLENLVTPKLEIDLFGEKWKCEFKLRNFAILNQQFKIKEDKLLKGLIAGDVKAICFAIWASTIVFAPFDATDPLKVEKTMNIEDLFNLTLVELQTVADTVVAAMQAALAKPKGGAGKKPATKKTANKKKKNS